MNNFKRIPVIFFVLALAACTTLVKDIEPPRITLQSVKPVPGESIAPRFEMTLRVVNPNNVTLDIAGIAYDVQVMERELVNGVSNDIPRIEPYSEQFVTLAANVNVFQLLRLLADVGTSKARSLDYQFNAKIDFDGLIPTLHIDESGVIDLSGRN